MARERVQRLLVGYRPGAELHQLLAALAQAEHLIKPVGEAPIRRLLRDRGGLFRILRIRPAAPQGSRTGLDRDSLA